MTRCSLLAVWLLCVAGVFGAEPACAEDEDLSSSAYLVFDPETGEFITVQDPDRTGQAHAASGLDGSASGDSGRQDSTLASMLPLAALALGVLAGVIILLRKGKRRTS